MKIEIDSCEMYPVFLVDRTISSGPEYGVNIDEETVVRWEKAEKAFP